MVLHKAPIVTLALIGVVVIGVSCAGPVSAPVVPSPTPFPQATATIRTALAPSPAHTPAISPTTAPTLPPAESRTTPPAATAAPAPTLGSMPSDGDAPVGAAKSDLAKRIGVDVGAITVVSSAATEWPDSALGCPKPGFMYSQVITPGYRIVLQAGGKQYEYHSDRGSTVVFCSER